ncbi:MAG: S8 family serine peptidase [Clostridia bacterium]|nr:S8 family serine peptidase [Clostridia bacterium]
MYKQKIIVGTFFVGVFVLLSFIVSGSSNNKVKETIKLPKDDIFFREWGLYNNAQEVEGQKGDVGVDINILKAWNLTKGSNRVVIGVLDTGIDIKHREISNNIFINRNEIPDNKIDDDKNGFIDDINGWDFYNNDNTVYDYELADYHGTSVAGIIASAINGDGICGVSPNVKILPLKFMNGSSGSVKDAIRAIEYASSLGVKIINCSWDNNVFDKELKRVIEKHEDILFICSAGKQGADLDKTPAYPACYNLPNILTVAAINNKGELYKISGYGSKADVAAPGENIVSIMPDNNYDISSGTSIAAPFVTGTAALIKSCKYNISPKEMCAVIKQNVKLIKSLQGKVSTGGIVDAYAAVKSVSTKEKK